MVRWMDGCEMRWMDVLTDGWLDAQTWKNVDGWICETESSSKLEFLQHATAAATCTERRGGPQINIGVNADYCETPSPINELRWIPLKKCNGGSICFLNGRIDSPAVRRRLARRLLLCPLAHLKKKKRGGAGGREGESLIGNFLFWH